MKNNLIRFVKKVQNASAQFVSYDFTEFPIDNLTKNDFVYCDPPYANLPNGTYDGKGFDSDAFWEWARTRDYPVYVSEYKAPDDFVSIWSKKRGGLQEGNGYAKNTTHIEHLFVHQKWLKQGEL